MLSSDNQNTVLRSEFWLKANTEIEFSTRKSGKTSTKYAFVVLTILKISPIAMYAMTAELIMSKTYKLINMHFVFFSALNTRKKKSRAKFSAHL